MPLLIGSSRQSAKSHARPTTSMPMFHLNGFQLFHPSGLFASAFPHATWPCSSYGQSLRFLPPPSRFAFPPPLHAHQLIVVPLQPIGLFSLLIGEQRLFRRPNSPAYSPDCRGLQSSAILEFKYHDVGIRSGETTNGERPNSF